MYLSKITSDFANEVCIEVEGERARDVEGGRRSCVGEGGLWATGRKPEIIFWGRRGRHKLTRAAGQPHESRPTIPMRRDSWDELMTQSS